jgi:hypothetical protein
MEVMKIRNEQNIQLKAGHRYNYVMEYLHQRI